MIRWEVQPHKRCKGQWAVEGVGPEQEAVAFGAVFYGPHAEERAKHYALVMNGPFRQPLPPMICGNSSGLTPEEKAALLAQDSIVEN